MCRSAWARCLRSWSVIVTRRRGALRKKPRPRPRLKVVVDESPPPEARCRTTLSLRPNRSPVLPPFGGTRLQLHVSSTEHMPAAMCARWDAVIRAVSQSGAGVKSRPGVRQHRAEHHHDAEGRTPPRFNTARLPIGCCGLWGNPPAKVRKRTEAVSRSVTVRRASKR
jgi:hypothetical protein